MISPTAEYALRAVVAIAMAKGHAQITPDLARTTKVPPGYLPKVLQTLRKAGIVLSRRGLGGGFTLSRPAEQITVLEVINAVDPIRRIDRCPLGIDSHGTNLCPMHKRLDEAIESVQRTFAATTIDELLSAPGRSTPLCAVEKSVTLGLPSKRAT